MASANNTKLICPLLQSMMDNVEINKDGGANTVVVTLHAIFSAMGILENALILWVVGFRVQRSVAAVWVLNLALSDFLVALTLPLFTFYLHSSHSWELGQPLCVAQSALFFLNMFVSAFLLAAISLDRCLLVTRPLWSKTHRSVGAAWRICACGWLWAAANATPYFLFREVIARVDNRTLCYHNFARFSSPTSLEQDCLLRQEATALSKFLLAFLVPLSIIAGSYNCLSRRLRERLAHRKNHILSNSLRRHATRTHATGPLSPRFTKMVVAVITIFIFTWSPYHAFCLLEVASMHRPSIRSVVEVGLPLATTFSFLNSVLNPCLYAFSCPDFCVRIRESMGTLLEGLLAENEESTHDVYNNSVMIPEVEAADHSNSSISRES